VDLPSTVTGTATLQLLVATVGLVNYGPNMEVFLFYFITIITLLIILLYCYLLFCCFIYSYFGFFQTTNKSSPPVFLTV
jgi:hypothetical protein